MSEEILKIIDKIIENELSKQLDTIGRTEDAAMFIGELIETMYRKDPRMGESLRPALDILMDNLANSDDLQNPVKSEEYAEKIWEACDFAVNYYTIRDFIYYSFSLPKSIEWNRVNDGFEIKVIDKTIFRQIASEVLVFMINSQTAPPQDEDEIVLLKGTCHFDTSNPQVQKALSLIETKVDWKISYFFSVVPPDCDIDLGDGYSYKDFLLVYKSLLFNSLYERCYAAANELSNVVTYDENEFASVLAQDTQVSYKNCLSILRNVAKSSRGTFVYFEESTKYYLLPFSFSLKDGILAILKHHAQKKSDYFSGNFAGFLGEALVNKIELSFRKFKNFRIRTEINLQPYSNELPDIDVLAVSYEPSLGFHFFICEVKNNLPAVWAKEYLKSIGKKGFIPKAIEQMRRIQVFLNTDKGRALLHNIIMSEFAHLDMKKLFPTGFMAVIDFLVVTSQSIGMFLPSSKTAIINDSLLGEIVRKSDGDVNYIKYFLRNLDSCIDDCYSVSQSSFMVNDLKIVYDAPILKSLLAFANNQYLSVGELENLEKIALEENYSFINHIGLTQESDDVN